MQSDGLCCLASLTGADDRRCDAGAAAGSVHILHAVAGAGADSGGWWTAAATAAAEHRASQASPTASSFCEPYPGPDHTGQSDSALCWCGHQFSEFMIIFCLFVVCD